MAATNPRYIARLQPVLDHIRGSLDRPLRLDMLADKANFSSFHFHRVFKAAMGETVNAHVRRLRMERGYFLLRSSRRARIIDVAMACGYASQSAFTRDFKRHFRVTPGRVLDGKAGLDGASNPEPRHSTDEPLPVVIDSLPEMQVISKIRFGSYDFRIGLAWIYLILKARRSNLLTPDSRKIGIVYDDPEVTPGDKCRFDAAVSVKPGPNSRRLPTQRCAMLDYSGSFARLGEMIDRLYGEWLLSSDYQPAEYPLMMFFPGHLHEYKRFRLCLPITPLASA